MKQGKKIFQIPSQTFCLLLEPGKIVLFFLNLLLQNCKKLTFVAKNLFLLSLSSDSGVSNNEADHLRVAPKVTWNLSEHSDAT